jgi:hypothetical protein
MTVPGRGWVTAYTIASEIGDIRRFASPKKLTGYRPVSIRAPVRQPRLPLTTQQARFPPLRWALTEAAPHAARDPRYRGRCERTKRRLGPSAVPRCPSRGGACGRRPVATSWLRTNPSLRQAPLSNWSLDDPPAIGPPEQLPIHLALPSAGDREMSAARSINQPAGPIESRDGDSGLGHSCRATCDSHTVRRFHLVGWLSWGAIRPSRLGSRTTRQQLGVFERGSTGRDPP